MILFVRKWWVKGIYDEIGEQLGDVPHTYADINKANRDLNYEPKVIRRGIKINV